MRAGIAETLPVEIPQLRKLIFDSFIETPPETDDELHWWIRTFTGYDIPKRASGICPDHVSPFSFIADQFFERTTSTFGFANRSGGKTFMTAVLNLVDLIFRPGISIVLAGAVRHQAQEGYRYLLELIGGDPLIADMLQCQPTMDRTALTNGSWIRITVCTYGGLNGPHPTRLRWDEVELIHQTYIAEGLCLGGYTPVLTSRGYVPIKEVRVGDRVLSYSTKGGRVCLAEVSWIGETGVLDTITLEFSSGRRLTCTPGHRILCEGGEYEQAGRLTPGRRILGAEVPWMREATDTWGATSYWSLRGLLAQGKESQSHQASLSGLWRRYSREGQARWSARQALQGMCNKICSAASSALSRLRQAISAKGYYSLPGVFLEAYATSGAAPRFPAPEGGSATKEATHARGALDDGTSYLPTATLRSDSSIWNLAAGFRSQGRSGSNRSPRQLLARPAESEGSRQAETQGSRKGWLQGDRSPLGQSPHVVELLRVSPGPRIPVYDISVPGYNNFLANGVFVHNSMTQSHPAGYKAMDTFTSTRKISSGTVQKLFDEKDQRNLKIYGFCIWENLQKCTRKCKGDPVYGDCGAYAKPDKDGVLKGVCGILDGAAEPHGKAQLLPDGGFYQIEDFIRKVSLIDRMTLETQWFNYKPTGGALVYGEFFKSEPPYVCTTAEAMALLDRAKRENNWMRVIGIDFGSNFAVEYFMQDPQDQTWYGYYELYWTQDQDMPLELRARRIREADPLGWSTRAMVFADPSGRQQITDLGSYGHHARIDAVPANNDVFAGLNHVKGLYDRKKKNGYPSLRHFSIQKQLIKEHGELYVHPIMKTGDVDRDKILKKNDHCSDAARYALCSVETIGTTVYTQKRLRGVW